MFDDREQPTLADILKDLMLYGSFVGAVWGGVVSFLKWWEDKYELFWNMAYGLIISVIITVIVWAVRREEISPLVNGGTRRVYQFTSWTRWVAVAVTTALLLFVTLLGGVYWQDLHGYVSTPELAVLESPASFWTGDLDENKQLNWAMYRIGEGDVFVPGKTAYGSLMLDFVKKDNCKYVEIVGVSVVVERCEELGKLAQLAGASTETRILEYRALLNDALGSYPAKLAQQAKQVTAKGNPVIDDSLPVRIIVAVRGKKQGLYTVRGELVVKYHGKKETIRSDKSVILACFEEGKIPKGLNHDPDGDPPVDEMPKSPLKIPPPKETLPSAREGEKRKEP